MKIAAKAKMWFGEDIAKETCKTQGGIFVSWHNAALYADIQGVCREEEDEHARQEMA